MPTREYHLYRLYFWILCNKKYFKGFKDTRPYLNRVQEKPWSFNGPYRAPKRDLKIFENFGVSFRLCLLFLCYILPIQSNHIKVAAAAQYFIKMELRQRLLSSFRLVDYISGLAPLCKQGFDDNYSIYPCFNSTKRSNIAGNVFNSSAEPDLTLPNLFFHHRHQTWK